MSSRPRKFFSIALATLVFAACTAPSDSGTLTSPPPTSLPVDTQRTPTPPPPADTSKPRDMVPWVLAATVGEPVRIDVSTPPANSRAALGPSAAYSARVLDGSTDLSVDRSVLSGTPHHARVTRVEVSASLAMGVEARDTLSVVVFTAGLSTPRTPASSFIYALTSIPLPAHLAVVPGFPPGFTAAELDSSQVDPITDAGAALGRVLFYDRRLSVTDSLSCGSCHQQSHGFADSAQFSVGVHGQLSTRRAMALAGVRFSAGRGLFWDSRTRTLEELATQPIENPRELGSTLPDVIAKISATDYYGPMFERAFGSRVVTKERVSRALAQFLRSLVPTNSVFDRAHNGDLAPNSLLLPISARNGFAHFLARGCASCHFSSAQMMAEAANNGLDAVPTDTGAGRGRFHPPSLRNVAVRPPFMHDGRFKTLDEVIDFYNAKVNDTPDLDQRMRERFTGPVRRLNMTLVERDELRAFLESLTDYSFLEAERFSDPFAPPRVSAVRRE